MQRQCANVEFSLVNYSGLLKVTCLLCGRVLGWSKDPKLLATLAQAHTCKIEPNVRAA
jgi:hypothetical protein